MEHVLSIPEKEIQLKTHVDHKLTAEKYPIVKVNLQKYGLVSTFWNRGFVQHFEVQPQNGCGLLLPNSNHHILGSLTSLGLFFGNVCSIEGCLN